MSSSSSVTGTARFSDIVVDVGPGENSVDETAGCGMT